MIFYDILLFLTPYFYNTLPHLLWLFSVIFASFSVIGRVLGCAGWWVTPIHFLYPQLSHSVTVFMLNISSSIKLAESEERRRHCVVISSSDIWYCHDTLSGVSSLRHIRLCLIQLINNLKREISFAVLLSEEKWTLQFFIGKIQMLIILCKYNGSIPSSTLST